ncbi:MAG: amino acid transport protein [Planctomycetota bacterium]
MNLDTYVLFLSLFVSTIGMGYFMYGKKTQTFSFMLSGAVMMFYGYFVESFWLALAVGVVLAVVPFFVR